MKTKCVLKCVQQNVCLALTGAIRGMAKEKNLSRTRIGVSPSSTLVQKTYLFYKVLKKGHLQYLINLIPPRARYTRKEI